ncbi:MAG TPA: hypothetical protein VFQ60_01860 [Patescibacteria group bacterium]|nr:hypothetical protein [Patescibacteria group bacterium]
MGIAGIMPNQIGESPPEEPDPIVKTCPRCHNGADLRGKREVCRFCGTPSDMYRRTLQDEIMRTEMKCPPVD